MQGAGRRGYIGKSHVAVAFILIGLALTGSIASSQEIPRHPPIILKQTVTINATLFLDSLDIEFLAYIAIQQINNTVIISNTGNTSGWYLHLINALQIMARQAEQGYPLRGINELKKSLNSLNNTQLALLAEKAPRYLPVCPKSIVYHGANTTFYAVANPLGYLPYQDCQAPTTTITLESPLDTLIALLTLREASGLISIVPRYPGESPVLTRLYTPAYLAEIVHIPRQLVSKELVEAIIEGKLQITKPGEKERVNKTLIEKLLDTIRNGSKEEATSALKKLNDYAKQGLIPWSLYEEALREYKQRFGSPNLVEARQEKAREEEVNLTNFLQGLQHIVVQAEKARIEAQGGGVAPKHKSKTIHITTISPPSNVLLGLSGIGLLIVVMLAERESLAPITNLARLLAGRPAGGPEWCYSTMILVLRLRGKPKYPYETPREYLERIKDSLSPEAQVLLEEITRAYEAKVYGGIPTGFDPGYCSRKLRRVLIGGV